MNEQQCREYLERIGHQGEISSTAQCLDALITAHLQTVPFENLEACWQHQVPSLKTEDIFQKVVKRKRGGYCFELNKLFFELLKSLGFEVMPVAVRITWMKEEPAALLHRATVVSLGEQRYLCDVGYGGPGPKGVLELKEGIQKVKGEWFRIRTDAGEYHKHTMYMDKLHGKDYREMFRFLDQEAEEADFGVMNFFCARSESTPFSQKPVINLALKDGSAALTGTTLTIRKNGEVISRECQSEEEQKEWLNTYFGIKVE